MNHVRGNGDRQVAAYCPRLRSQRICCSNKLPKRLNSIGCLENHENDRTRSHVIDEFLEERFTFVDTVKGFCFSVGDLVKSQLLECETFPFQPGQDFAHEAVLDCVRFEECEGSLA